MQTLLEQDKTIEFENVPPLTSNRLFSRIGHILVARQDDISHWSAGHWTLISSPKGRW